MEVSEQHHHHHEDVDNEKPASPVIPGRVYLRRIMYNGARAETTQQSEEDKRRTLISIQGGKTFGRSSSNDVIFLDKTEIVEREPQYISRVHARITHCVKEGVEGYWLVDSSENGTYINDTRLKRNQERLLSVGDTIKFGHKNGSQHEAGKTYPNPHADFAFCATLVTADQPLYEVLEDIKKTRVKIYIGSPFVEEVDSGTPRELTPELRMKPTRGGVQQQEADSTDGKFAEVVETPAINHPGNSSSSSSSSSSTSSSTAPSSSTQAVTDSSTDPSSSNAAEPSTSSSPVTTMALGAQQHPPTPPVSTPHDEQQPSTSRQHEEKLVLVNYPKKAPHAKKFDDHVTASWTNCTARRSRTYWKMVQDQATRILKLHRDMTPYAEMLEYLLDINVGKEFKPSKQQKSEMIDQFWHWNKRVKDADKFYAYRDLLSELLMEEEPETRKIRKFIVEYVPAAPGSKELEQSEYSAFESLISDQKFYVPIAKQVNIMASDFVDHLRDIKLLDTESNEAVQKVVERQPVQTKAMEPKLMKWVSHISSYHQCHKQFPPPPVMMQPFTHYLQQATGILEVVPRDSVIVHKSAFNPVLSGAPRNEMDEERHSASSGSTDPQEEQNAQSFRNRTDSVESEIVDVVGGAEDEEEEEEEEEKTITPTPEDERLQMKDRQSSTPRIDGQSASSAVVSALPTPLSSPIPRSGSAPGPSAPGSSSITGSRSALASPALPGSSSTSSNARKEEDIPSTSSAPASSSKPPRKQQKERRNKQLDDESSGESESDDGGGGGGDEKTPNQKKKQVRRSARAPNATPANPRKSKKQKEAAGGGGEGDPGDSEEVTPRAAATSAANSARRKALKRTASQTGLKEPRKERNKEGVDPDEPPKKKRGRKKATPPPRDDQDDEEDEEQNGKEQCGVAGRFCLCSKWEKKYTLEWVSCSACEQWYHAFCVRMDNRKYREEEVFTCCGDTITEEARHCLAGRIHQNYMSLPQRARPVPETPLAQP